jgi:hypothetical protein
MRSALQSAALIDAWFDTLREPLREIAEALRALILAEAPGLEVSIKWGNLVFSHRRAHALAIVVNKDHVNLQVFNGRALAPQFPLLEGTGKGLRHVRLRAGQAFDAAALRTLVRASIDELDASGPAAQSDA